MPYYNENHPGTAEWLRELIDRQCIAPGEVDDRSIVEVTPDDIAGYEQCHWFAGIAGWSLALDLAGWGDRPVWTASLPCQPWSVAGKKRGERDERDLWAVFKHLVEECRPPTIFGEQVGGETGREWISRIQVDLHALGYASTAVDLCGASIGSPQVRQRHFWVAHRGTDQGRMGDTEREGLQGHTGHVSETIHRKGSTGSASASGIPWEEHDWLECDDGKSRRIEPGVAPMVNGLPEGVGQCGSEGVPAFELRLRGYGNAIIPQLAAEFVSAFMEVTGA